MCLITGKRNYQIAKEDIIVWKNLTKDYKSASRGFQYEKGVLNKATLEFIDKLEYSRYMILPADPIDGIHLKEIYNWEPKSDYNPDLIYIRKGFHSYLTIDRASNYKLDDIITFKFIIPSGSRYIKDDTGLIVSNKIIME